MVETAVKKESRYQVFCNIDLNRLVCLGIISSHLLDWKFIYEAYLKELKDNDKTVAIQYVADEFGFSDRHVKRIVKFMSD